MNTDGLGILVPRTCNASQVASRRSFRSGSLDAGRGASWPVWPSCFFVSQSIAPNLTVPLRHHSLTASRRRYAPYPLRGRLLRANTEPPSPLSDPFALPSIFDDAGTSDTPAPSAGLPLSTVSSSKNTLSPGPVSYTLCDVFGFWSLLNVTSCHPISFCVRTLCAARGSTTKFYFSCGTSGTRLLCLATFMRGTRGHPVMKLCFKTIHASFRDSVCVCFFLVKTLCFVVVVSVDHAEPSSAIAS